MDRVEDEVDGGVEVELDVAVDVLDMAAVLVVVL